MKTLVKKMFKGGKIKLFISPKSLLWKADARIISDVYSLKLRKFVFGKAPEFLSGCYISTLQIQGLHSYLHIDSINIH